jgi:hypothetical protein
VPTTTSVPAVPTPASPVTTIVATTVPAPTTPATAPPPVYGGVLSLGRGAGSSRTATVVANALDGLPAGTTLTFTFSGAHPSWSVAFTTTSLCVGLPAALSGDAANSLSVRCLIPELASGGRASVTFVVDDPLHDGNDSDAVRVLVAVQRPGGTAATQCDGPGC